MSSAAASLLRLFLPDFILENFEFTGRWLNLETNKVIYRNWTLVEKGTRMTEEFAAFLKEINRYSPE